MLSTLRRYRKPLFVAVIVIFLIGTFVGLGGYLLTSNDNSSAVASVGEAKISYMRFQTRVNQYADYLREQRKGGEVSDAELKQIKQETLRDMIIDELLLVKAQEMGISVTDQELARDIRNTTAFQRDGQFVQEIENQVVHTIFHETVTSYEEMRRKSLMTAKLKQIIFNSAKLAPAEVAELYAREKQPAQKDWEKAKKEGFKGTFAEFQQQSRAYYVSRVQQQRAVDIINFYLRQTANQLEVRSFLDARESGA